MLTKITSAIASVSLVMTVFAPAISASDLEISGNGDSSTNTIKVETKCDSKVYQTNKTLADVQVDSSASTGSNTIKKTTGGDAAIDTGDATSTVTVTVMGGDNSATPPNCCACVEGGQSQLISGNGDSSVNKIESKKEQKMLVDQYEKTKLKADLKSRARTGKNKIKKTPGSGSEIKTGDAESTVDVTVQGGSNNLP